MSTRENIRLIARAPLVNILNFFFFKELNFQKQVNLLTYHMISILNNKVV